MKTIKTILPLLFVLGMTFAARATLLWEDATNYPYVNGPLEGQGQWFCYSPTTPHNDILVSNNVVLLNATNIDEPAAPTNGWTPSASGYTYASFEINVSQLPDPTLYSNGTYFCELRNNYPSGNTNAANVCHVFFDQIGTSLPGTYRLGIANFATEFTGAGSLQPPINYPMDLATNTWYSIVIVYDNSGDDLQGASLWINPSIEDFENFENNQYTDTPGLGYGYVYATDDNGSANQQNISLSEISFYPAPESGSEGISNVMAGTAFTDVVQTNLPVFGIQPVGGTNYSGNPATFISLGAGVDLTYQWHSATYGPLTDGQSYGGATFTGSTSNILIANNLSGSDTYYCVATDAYGDTAASSNAVETVITTPTPVFFPTNVVAVNLTNNLFTTANITDTALGTGPIYYQWYFEPTNSSSAYTPLSGQNSAALNLDLVDYSYQGNYYLVASNALDGGTIAVGPTNSLAEITPVVASLEQLHNLMISFINTPGNLFLTSPGSTINLSSNVTVSGYVTTRTVVPGDGLGNTYTEYFIQDAQGFGAEIYIASVGNSNTPPLGANISVTGQAEIYHAELEVAAAAGLTSIITNTDAAPMAINPILANFEFNIFATNMLGTNSLLAADAMVTFTNVYIYASKTGTAVSPTADFYTNSYTTLYFTVGGPYNNNLANGPIRTNVLEIYQFGDNYPYTGTAPSVYSSFYEEPLPTHCYQLTGAYVPYESSANAPGPEIEPSVYSDYVLTPPVAPTNSIAVVKGVATVTWPVQPGSTYSVYSSTNLLGPWTQSAYGLGYYPTNGSYADTNKAPAKFYQVTSP